MSPERWQKVREVFDQAAECQPAEAERVLRAACGADSGLYDEVRRMLSKYERSSPLDRAVWDDVPLGVFRAGQIVAGRYRIVRYLNRGGMGEVYEALDLELSERVALKTLLPEVAADARMIARFKQEIQLSRKIGHRNVCRVFDLARHPVNGSSPDTVFFLTMEFLDGETLAGRLEREGRMSISQALPLIEQMAEALDAAHAAGVIHRDFKPSNVMLTEKRAVVTDFGLARSHRQEQESTASLSGRVMGTVDYMAPELLAGKQATFASDIYALGMVVYKMITGVLPFASDTPLAAAILRSKEPIPSPKAFVQGLDMRCERAIVRALDPNPSRRFTSAADFVRGLRGESTAITLALPLLSRRKWIGIAAAMAVLAGGFLGWREWANARRRPSREAELLYQKGVEDISAGAYFAATKALEESVKAAPHFALAHARLAEAWIELEMPEKAQQQMLLALREDTGWLPQSERLQIEAIDLTVTREYAAAAAKYEALVKLASTGEPSATVDLGRAYEKAGKPDKAIQSYTRAANSSEHSPAAWLRLGVLYARQSNSTKSDEAFANSERLYQLTSNQEGLIEVAFERGAAAESRGGFSGAARYVEAAGNTARMAGNMHEEIRAELELSLLAYRVGDSDVSERLAQEALDTARENRMQGLAVEGTILLGNSLRGKGALPKAEAYLKTALSLAQQDGSAQLTAAALAALAGLHDQVNQPGDAETEAKKALAYYQANHFALESIKCLTIVGRSRRRAGDYAGALGNFQASLKLAEAVQDRFQQAFAHESIGSLYYVRENYPRALEQYLANLGLSGDPQRLAWAELQCASTLWLIGRYGDAEQHFDQAEKHGAKFPLLLVNVRWNRADMALSRGKYRESEAIVRGLAAGAALSAAASADLKRIAGLAALAGGRKQEAVRKCAEALHDTERLNDATSLLRARLALLMVFVAMHNRPDADALFGSIEPVLPEHPESRWRALAIMMELNPDYRASARKAFIELADLWGRQPYEAYVSRPDIKHLSWPFISVDTAER